MTIRNKADHEVTLAALDELKSLLKRLGSFPEVNLREIENLREQLKDLQAELDLYEVRHEADPIKVELVNIRAGAELGWHYELKFGEKHSDYTVHLTDPEVTRLIKKLQDQQRTFGSRAKETLDEA